MPDRIKTICKKCGYMAYAPKEAKALLDAGKLLCPYCGIPMEAK